MKIVKHLAKVIYMKKNSQLVKLLLVITLSGCSQVQNLFPDKQKGYQLAAEIPELIIPGDLSSNDIALYDENKLNVTKVPHITYPQPLQSTKDPYIAAKKVMDNYVEMLNISSEHPRIRIYDSMARSWRVVGKVLSRNSIEIIARNEQNLEYIIIYDPDFKKVEDGGLWNETLFIFGPDPANETEFKVKLEYSEYFTDVSVSNKNDELISTGAAKKLLNLIYLTIDQNYLKNNGTKDKVSFEAKIPKKSGIKVFSIEEGFIEQKQYPLEKKSNKKPSYIDLVNFSGGGTRIRIASSLDNTWQLVEKTLNKKSVKILSKDRSNKSFIVDHIDKDSFFASKEQLTVKLSKNSDLIEIFILDEKNEPLSTGVALDLLTILYNAINDR